MAKSTINFSNVRSWLDTFILSCHSFYLSSIVGNLIDEQTSVTISRFVICIYHWSFKHGVCTRKQKIYINYSSKINIYVVTQSNLRLSNHSPCLQTEMTPNDYII